MNRLPIFLFGLVTLLGCSSDEKPGEQAGGVDTPATKATTVAQSAKATTEAAGPEPPGNAENGRKLVEQYECHRCHEGLEELKPIVSESHSFRCHKEVLDGEYDDRPEQKRWKKNVALLAVVPSLESVGKRLQYDWLVSFIDGPHDLRPNMVSTMPRLNLTREQARDIASYLKKDSVPPEARSLEGGDAAAGRKLMEQNACGTCHLFGGVAELPDAPKSARETRFAVQLAPDYRFTRDRVDPKTIISWLLDPNAIKHNTEMPQTEMSEQDARNIATYLLRTKLAPAPDMTIPALPKPLDRRVTYDEVYKKVLSVTCRHCHENPDTALGDGGPGNTGGFGFKGRGLEVTTYERISAGYIDDNDERQSTFRKMEDGTPRFVASLMARYAEEAGQPNPEIRGMPLALPPLALEDIQLVATWVAQGRPR